MPEFVDIQPVKTRSGWEVVALPHVPLATGLQGGPLHAAAVAVALLEQTAAAYVGVEEGPKRIGAVVALLGPRRHELVGAAGN